MTQIDSRPPRSVETPFIRTSGEPPPAVAFERLLTRYERRFGSQPPVSHAAVDDVNRLMRSALAEASERTQH